MAQKQEHAASYNFQEELVGTGMAADSGVYDHADRLHNVPAYKDMITIRQELIVEREAIEGYYGGLDRYLVRLSEERPYLRDRRMQYVIEQGYGWQMVGELDELHNCYRISVRCECPAELWTFACLKG